MSALLLGACGSDDEGSGEARTVEPTTTVAEDAASTTEVPVQDVPLDQVVVQLSDLPTGWTVSPPDDDDESDDTFCEGQDPINEIDPSEEAESSFQQSDFGPFVFSGVGIYADDDEASGVMDAFTEVANACQSFTEVDEDGIESTYTISPLSFPELGDDTFAFRMSVTSPFGPFNLDVAAVRDGARVAILVNGGLGATDSELTESLMRTMVDRL